MFFSNCTILLILTMSGKLGSIEPFNEAEEDFDTYVSQVKMYFVTNQVDDAIKVAAFFTLAGSKFLGWLGISFLHRSQRRVLLKLSWTH